MKFLCPNCKAKYQISDEKIVGRTLKMDCRRCSHPIVIRGDKLGAQPEQQGRGGPKAPAKRGGSHVGPLPSSRQSSRTALGADFRKNPTGSTGAAASSKPPALDQWHVAINDVPVGPMKREEIAQKIGAGAVKADSLCWREGFDDWRPVKDVPELAPLLRRPVAAPPAPARALPRATPGPRPARPPSQRIPAQSSSRSASPVESARPSARGNVVPIGGRLGAAAAPAVEDFSEEMTDDEPTRVGSSADLLRLEEEQRRIDEEERAAQSVEEPEKAEAKAPEKAPETEAPEAEAPERPVSATLAGEEDAFDPFASQRASVPSATPGPVETPEALPPSASFAAPVPERPAKRGLPVGAWIAIAGATAFGATLAVMVGIKLFSEPTPIATTGTTTGAEPTVPVDPGEATADPELVLPEPSGEAEAETESGEEEQAAPTKAPAPSRGSGGARTPRESTATAERPATNRPQLSAAEEARLRQFEDDGAGAAPIAASSRNNVLAQDNQRGGAELTSEQIRSVVNRERSMVQRCYETATRAAGQSPALRIDVDLTIGGSGTVTSATARGPGFGNLSECIERTVRRWRFPASGGTSRLSIPFVFQGQD